LVSFPNHFVMNLPRGSLEHLKCHLANGLYHEEAFRVSEMLRELDRKYDERNNDPKIS